MYFIIFGGAKSINENSDKLNANFACFTNLFLTIVSLNGSKMEFF